MKYIILLRCIIVNCFRRMIPFGKKAACFCAVVAILLLCFSCGEDEPKPSPESLIVVPQKPAEPAPVDKYTKISDVRALFKGQDMVINEEIWIKGTVVSDYRRTEFGGLDNNTSAKSIVIQDDSAGIQLYCSAENSKFGFADEVEINLKGQKISKYNGLLQVNGLPLDRITKIGTKNVSPMEISAKDLLSGKFESQYVAVRDVEVATEYLGRNFSEAAQHTSIGIVSRTGESFILFTSKFASFRDRKLPSGSGTLKGVACVFNENYQIILAREDDADGLTGPRFATGDEFVLGTSEITVDGFEDSFTVNLMTNVPWSATSSDSGFVVSPAEGNPTEFETVEVSVSYARNPSSTSSRTAVITFRTDAAGVKDKELKLKVTQEPYEDLKSDAVPQWMELPKVEPEDGFVYINHKYTYYSKEYRNFSLWYDCRDKYSLWTAYPLFVTSQVSERSDLWDYDPKVPKRYQPKLFSAFGISNVGRGHQVPSGDRLHCDKANEQTFYFTNLTAQNASLNGGVWANLEKKVREWAGGCDTLYVVTGALASTSEDQEKIYYNDNDGRPVAVPKIYYKALLRYEIGGETNGGYDAIGFVYENRAYDYSAPKASDAMSIDELEEFTGFDFFHNLPDELEKSVEESADKGKWGLK